MAKSIFTEPGKGRSDMFKKTLFKLGQVVATPGALAAIESTGENPLSFLFRHNTGDWGDVPEEDAKENQLSIEQGFRILSSYRLKDDKARIWIITEADRSATTILLPEEY